MTWYLRLEGLNLNHFVYDTNDLSTIRGGGLLLLDTVDEIQSQFGLEPISTGASSGLFALGDVGADEARRLRDEVAEHLQSDDKRQYATFAVDVLETDAFAIAREGMLALNRWRQMQSPSLAVPSDRHGTDACAVDRVRPAVMPGRGDERRISRSVSERRDYGKDNKRRRFYADRSDLNEQDLPFFVNHFKELTGDSERGNLHHKMAVIHIDGNSFGALQTRLCGNAQAQRELDLEIKRQRRTLLRELLSATDKKRSWLTHNGRLRMETLLWGGDEFVWVVPAWVGLWTLGFFYDRARHWTLLGEPITHSAGLVLCHHNAPIHRITALARNLCESAKALGARSRNAVAYQVLESFDHAGIDPAAVAARRWPDGLDAAGRVLAGERLSEAWYLMAEIAGNLPRRRVHRAAADLLDRAAPSVQIEDGVQRGLDQTTREQLDRVRDTLNGGDASWIHLNELWDYLGG